LRWNPLEAVPPWFGTLEQRGCAVLL